MPTNVYFDTGTTSEQRLYEDLIIEQLKIYGQDVYYLPRKIANKDTIFGEDPASSFDDSYIIEMYVDNVDGYMGEQEIIKKFGLELRDDIVFTLSKLRWETLIKNNSDLTAERPQEGDLVLFPSAMIHYVEPHSSDFERISIAFNNSFRDIRNGELNQAMDGKPRFKDVMEFRVLPDGNLEIPK
jgi:hypothetical protein